MERVLRRLWPGDDVAFRDHLLRLDFEDRRLRFAGFASDATISAYCRRAADLRNLRVGCFVDGVLRGVAELNRTGGTPSSTAELAITVDRPHRDRGIGTALFGRLMTLARNRRIARIYMICLLEDGPMRSIAAKHHALTTTADGQVEGWVDLETFNPATLAEEAFGEGFGLIRSVLPTPVGAGLRPAGADPGGGVLYVP